MQIQMQDRNGNYVTVKRRIAYVIVFIYLNYLY